MKIEDEELFRVLAKYPKLIEENPELVMFMLRKCKEFSDGFFGVIAPVIQILDAVLTPFTNLFKMEEKK